MYPTTDSSCANSSTKTTSSCDKRCTWSHSCCGQVFRRIDDKTCDHNEVILAHRKLCCKSKAEARHKKSQIHPPASKSDIESLELAQTAKDPPSTAMLACWTSSFYLFLWKHLVNLTQVNCTKNKCSAIFREQKSIESRDRILSQINAKSSFWFQIIRCKKCADRDLGYIPKYIPPNPKCHPPKLLIAQIVTPGFLGPGIFD